MIWNGSLAKACPAHEAANEAIGFRHGTERLDNSPIHQPEVAGVERNTRIGEAIEDSIKRVRGGDLEARFAGS